MRTLCPNCATIFRITPDQLRARNGMVRCGQCQAVFNAFDSLIEEAPTPAATPGVASHDARSGLPEGPALPGPVAPTVQPVQAAATASTEPTALPEPDVADPPVTRREPSEIVSVEEEPPEQTAQAVREAGLAAVRDLTEAPGYSRWSAGALDATADIEVDENSGQRPVWPFAVVATMLLLALLGQFAWQFRLEIAQRLPESRQVWEAFGIDIPLARAPEAITLENSDLESDNTRGLLVLHATLKNRAPWEQAWPALELALTDANDAIVVRKVLNPSDYLPASADRRAFAAGSEIGLKLWLESKLPAAGYRLYVFYP